jgi:hypothetical protein
MQGVFCSKHVHKVPHSDSVTGSVTTDKNKIEVGSLQLLYPRMSWTQENVINFIFKPGWDL